MNEYKHVHFKSQIKYKSFACKIDTALYFNKREYFLCVYSLIFKFGVFINM